MRFVEHYRAQVTLAAPAEAVFTFLDDPARLAGHMSRRSLMMGGGRMSIALDGAGGRAVGSVLRLRGRFLGLPLAVDERVTRRRAPFHKVWQTMGAPKLIVLSAYRMGFELRRAEAGTALAIWIGYALPKTGLPARLVRWLAASYARWCVDRMISDAVTHFGAAAATR